MSSKGKALCLSVLVTMIYGLYPPFIQICYKEGATVSTILIISSFIRAIFFIVNLKRAEFKKLFIRSSLGISLKGGIYQFISTFCIYLSLLYIPGPVMITVFFSYTLMFMGYLYFKKELEVTFGIFISVISALIGISLAVGFWNSKISFNYLGVALALIAGFATFKRFYLFGKELKEESPNLLGARIYTMLFFLTPLTLIFYDFKIPSSYALLCITISGVSLGMASLLMLYAIKELGSFRFSIIAKVEPVFTAIFSMIILNQVLALENYLGILITIVSIAYYQYYEHKNRVPIIS